MATIATAQELAEGRQAVAELEAAVVETRTKLTRAALVDDIDYLAAELTDLRNRLRRAKSLLGDMEAGAGDFHDWTQDD